MEANNSSDYNSSWEPNYANGKINIANSRVNGKAEATGVSQAATSAGTIATADMLQ
jgi:hypothetical protein